MFLVIRLRSQSNSSLRMKNAAHQYIHDNTNINISFPNKKDYAIWNMAEDGHQSNKSTWKLIKSFYSNNLFLSNLWHKNLPYNCLFLLKRLIHNKLSFDEVISRFGNQITSGLYVVGLRWRILSNTFYLKGRQHHI